MKINRAYSLLEIKEVDDDARVIEGLASTPTPDRMGDIVKPEGAEFKLPIPLLWQHDSRQPIGHVTKAKVTKAGIEIRAEIAKGVSEHIDECWKLIKSGLVRGLSIGFRGLDTEHIPNSWGIIFEKWEWLELSAVTIPANSEATITLVKSIDTAQRAATGQQQSGGDQPDHNPGVSGTEPTATRKAVSLKPEKPRGNSMNIAEQIAAYEAKRAAHAARLLEIQKAAGEAGRSKNEAEEEEFKNLTAELKTIDNELADLRDLEGLMAKTAKPVVATEAKSGTESRNGSDRISIKAPEKLEPGIGYARLVKVKMAARLTGDTPLAMARRMYGENSEVFGIVTKANEVVAGTTVSGNWAADLVSAEGAAVAAFLEYLRPATILGKFGVGGVPSLTRLDFYTPYVIETGAGDAYWVGEGKPKPLTSFDYDRSTLTPLKIANIAVLTEENIRYSSPNSDVIVRNALVKAIAAGLDVAFVDPANSGSANVKPASVTNGAGTVVSTGTDADAIRLDVRALFQKFIDANNAPQQGVWIMSATNALALSMMVNALGQPEFSGISMNGGVFQGLPVIVSQHISNVVALVAADQIFLGDEGGVAVDMSREASIEMRSSGLGMDATAGTATAASVSMFQTNSVALRAERTINWKRARSPAVAYLTSVNWGGAVPAS